jgi:2-dehydro-3-deoxygluconokinase
MQPEIIALGEPMLEFNATDEGSLAEVQQFSVGWGGDTSNFAVAASRLGGRVGYLTRLGDDDFGESFMRLWQAEGVDTRHVARDPAAATGIYFISRKGARHYFTYYRNDSAASRMTPDFLPLEYVRGARLLHVSGISQAISTSACDTVFAAIDAASEAGVKISYDPNLRLKLWPLDRARAVIHETVTRADLVLPSYEDARELTGLQDPEEIAEFYLHMGPGAVVLKLGAEGALLAAIPGDGREGPIMRKFPACKVNSVDMAGAGDTFDGAFVTAWLEGLPLEHCVRLANAAGALTTTGLGAVRPIPSRKQAEDLLASAGSD